MVNTKQADWSHKSTNFIQLVKLKTEKDTIVLQRVNFINSPGWKNGTLKGKDLAQTYNA